MHADDEFDPIDTVVRDALSADRSAASRLAREALAGTSPNRRSLVPALAAFAIVVAGVIGVTRYVTSEPPIVIRGEGNTIVIERGSGRNRTTEVFRNDSPRGGVVVIREGGN